jgi:hypothetical protein
MHRDNNYFNAPLLRRATYQGLHVVTIFTVIFPHWYLDKKLVYQH